MIPGKGGQTAKSYQTLAKAGHTVTKAGQKAGQTLTKAGQKAGQTVTKAGQKAGQNQGKAGQNQGKVGKNQGKPSAKPGQTTAKPSQTTTKAGQTPAVPTAKAEPPLKAPGEPDLELVYLLFISVCQNYTLIS